MPEEVPTSECRGVADAWDIPGRIKGFIVSISRCFGMVGGSLIVVVMMTAVADVTARRLGTGLLGAYEIAEYAMAVGVSFCLGYVQAVKGNVAMDFLVSRVSPRGRSILSSVHSLLALIFCCLLVYAGARQMLDTMRSRAASSVLLIPTYPFIGLVAIGLLMLCFVLLADFLDQIRDGRPLAGK